MKPDGNKHILLYESCQLTKGAARTLLLDTQRQNIELLDNELFELFSISREQNLDTILKKYDPETEGMVLEYLEYLVDNEYAFFCDADEVPFFPVISKEWDHPAVVTNCILDFKGPLTDFAAYENIVKDLNKLGCENVQIRDYAGMDPEELDKLLCLFYGSSVVNIELVLKYAHKPKQYRDLMQKHGRITSFMLHSCKADAEIPTETGDPIVLTRQVIDNADCCGLVSLKYFNFRHEHYYESQKFNTCLNRKVTVDAEGNIKNCPAMKTSFGHISTHSLLQVVEQEEFRKSWHISKDSIDICKVCEFRHVCTDCRAFRESDHSHAKPFKCSYDPYKMEWA